MLLLKARSKARRCLLSNEILTLLSVGYGIKDALMKNSKQQTS